MWRKSKRFEKTVALTPYPTGLSHCHGRLRRAEFANFSKIGGYFGARENSPFFWFIPCKNVNFMDVNKKKSQESLPIDVSTFSSLPLSIIFSSKAFNDTPLDLPAIFLFFGLFVGLLTKEKSEYYFWIKIYNCKYDYMF